MIPKNNEANNGPIKSPVSPKVITPPRTDKKLINGFICTLPNEVR